MQILNKKMDLCLDILSSKTVFQNAGSSTSTNVVEDTFQVKPVENKQELVEKENKLVVFDRNPDFDPGFKIIRKNTVSNNSYQNLLYD